MGSNNRHELYGYAGHGRHSADRPISTFTPIAPPGTGKGTVVKFITEQYKLAGRNVLNFEVGDVVRQNIKDDTELGREAKRYYPKLLPNNLILPPAVAGLKAKHAEDLDAILTVDGMPREFGQIAEYEEAMEALGRNDVILHLSLLSNDPRVSRQISEERMIKRGEEASKKGFKPRQEDVDPELRAIRLDEADLLHEVVAHLTARNRVITIDATQDIEGVQNQVRALIFDRAHILQAV